MSPRTLLSPVRSSLAVLGNRSVRRLETALLLSETSGPAYGTALFVYAYGHGGATAVGVVGLSVMLPAALAAPLAGVLADRGKRSRVAAWAAVARSAFLMATALAMMLSLPLETVTIFAAVASVPSRIFYPTQIAMLPRLTRADDELSQAIALGSGIENLGSVAGPAVAGALLLLLGPAELTALCSVAMLAAALSIARVEERATADSEDAPRSAFFAEVIAGWHTIATQPALRIVISVYAFQTAVFGLLSVAIVELALSDYSVGNGGVGLLSGALGVGGVAGGLVAIAICTRLRCCPTLRLGTLLWGLPLVFMAIAPHYLTAIVLLTATGVGNVLVDVSSYTLIQRSTADELRGRVFGALEGAAVGAVALGSLAGGTLIEWIGVSGALVIAGLSLTLVAFVSRGPLERVDPPPTALSAKQHALMRPPAAAVD